MNFNFLSFNNFDFCQAIEETAEAASVMSGAEETAVMTGAEASSEAVMTPAEASSESAAPEEVGAPNSDATGYLKF